MLAGSFYIIALLSLSAHTQKIPSDISSIKKDLLYKGNISTARRELNSLYIKYSKRKDAASVKEILFVMGDYGNVPYRNLFKMCKSVMQDCSYYKAKVLEQDGNAGSAMELYLDAGYYDDYLRLKAYSGEDLDAIAKRYALDGSKILFYKGLVLIAKGEWSKAVTIFSDNTLKQDPRSAFYLGYAYLMLGENNKAQNVLQKRPDNMDHFQGLEYDRLDALIHYAENYQFKALDKLNAILRSLPNDFLSKRYVAQIYYRSGWFNKAEKIYAELISKEWRDTELYYLLSERCEMRIRNLRFAAAKIDANRIIKEYPLRKDFIAGLIPLYLYYGNLADAVSYRSMLSSDGPVYEQSLRAFVDGLILEYEQNYVAAVEMFKKAYSIFPTDEYNIKLKQAELNLKEMSDTDAPKANCKDYDVKRISNIEYEVTVKEHGFNLPSKYFVRQNNTEYNVNLPLFFNYEPGRIYFKDKEKLWIDTVKRIWSVYGLSFDIKKGVQNKVDLVPWPSSFYLKRTSSHEWSVLTPPRVIAHEVGHLLGLDDEYYETDERILSRNKGRYIGPMGSIMRNMYNGMPEKRHIQFILSPIECK